MRFTHPLKIDVDFLDYLQLRAKARCLFLASIHICWFIDRPMLLQLGIRFLMIYLSQFLTSFSSIVQVVVPSSTSHFSLVLKVPFHVSIDSICDSFMVSSSMVLDHKPFALKGSLGIFAMSWFFLISTLTHSNHNS